MASTGANKTTTTYQREVMTMTVVVVIMLITVIGIIQKRLSWKLQPRRIMKEKIHGIKDMSNMINKERFLKALLLKCFNVQYVSAIIFG